MLAFMHPKPEGKAGPLYVNLPLLASRQQGILRRARLG